jgi:hypothetical protein
VGGHYIAGAAHRRHDGTASTTREILRRRLFEPKGALARKLIKRKRISGAGIAPINNVRKFGEYRAHFGFPDL